MNNQAQTPQEYFRVILMTVVGQAYGAAGYALQDVPIKWAGGMFRFSKSLNDGLFGYIDYQLLSYVDSEWSSGMPSRFRVVLTRTDQLNPSVKSTHARYVQRDLSALVVEDFGVPILPSASHWWMFKNVDEMGKGLAEAGHLVVGYGMPWLAGDLTPPEK